MGKVGVAPLFIYALNINKNNMPTGSIYLCVSIVQLDKM